MKKLLFFIFIILFFISIYKDLSSGTSIPGEHQSENETNQGLVEQTYDVVKIKLAPGDTVLSIVEKLNPTITTLSIDEILNDFRTINPTADPNSLNANTFYFFPKYRHN